MKTVSIAIAENQIIFRTGLIHFFKQNEYFDVSTETNDGLKLIKELKKRPADIAIIDTNVKNLSGFETTLILKKKYPDLKIIILSDSFSFHLMMDYFKIGANSFLIKNVNYNVLFNAIEKLRESEFFFDKGVPLNIRRSIINGSYSPNSSFSSKEIEIIKLICDEKKNQEIADILCLSKRTIEWYRSEILAKMKVKSPIGILKYAINHKLYRIN